MKEGGLRFRVAESGAGLLEIVGSSTAEKAEALAKKLQEHFKVEDVRITTGKGESIWDTYLHKHPEFTPDRSNGDVAADSYHRYMDDVNIIEDLGVKYYRMSISWPRILPNGFDNHLNMEGVKYYVRIFKELKKRGIAPVVTLFHWDIPTPLMDMGGWTNPKIVDYFEDYARVAFTLFGSAVKIWTTINEPHQHCTNGYGGKYFVPALNSRGIADYLCNHYILLAHARAYRLYDEKFRETQKGIIGITLDAFYAEPKNASSVGDIAASEAYLQMHVGLYAHTIFSREGDYPEMVRARVDYMSRKQGFSRSRLPYFSSKEIKMLRNSSDFFGLNHYTTYQVSPSSNEPDWSTPSLEQDTGVKLEQNPAWPVPGSTWLSVYPEGFRKMLNWITKEYGKDVPIIITENGMSDFGGLEDYDRVSYYNEYIKQMLISMYEDGCNVIGYFAWTLMDDFEWADGYVSKFGLYHVDFESPERTRTPKLSAKNYAEIVRTRKLNFDYMKPSAANYEDNKI